MAMEKEYVKPVIEMAKMEMESLLAASESIGLSDEEATWEMCSKRSDIFDEEEE